MRNGLSRRHYLAAVASTFALAGCPRNESSRESNSTSTAPETPRQTPDPLTFDTVHDAVDDLGFDPTGDTPIDPVFEEAYESDTLIEFPPGEYRIEAEHSATGVSRFGIRGTGEHRRDVRIRPSAGRTLKWLKAVDAGPHLVENLSFDERSDDTTQLSLWFRTSDGSLIRNVEWLGRTPDDSGVGYTLTAEVPEVEGVFTIDRVYAGLDELAVPVEYPNGVAFLRSGPAHRGELYLRRPVIYGRNSNATRSTGLFGVLTIEGGEFVNNQNASIRFGAGDHPSKVSSATGTYVKVDGSRDSADAIRLDGERQSGATFRDVSVEWTKSTGRGVITAPEWGDHGRAEFYDCVVRNDGELRTVVAEQTVADDAALVFENCDFTGSGGGFVAVGRPGSVVRDSCVDMPNASFQGFETEDITRTNCRSPSGIDSR